MKWPRVLLLVMKFKSTVITHTFWPIRCIDSRNRRVKLGTQCSLWDITAELRMSSEAHLESKNMKASLLLELKKLALPSKAVCREMSKAKQCTTVP